jgi:hypothetical protein
MVAHGVRHLQLAVLAVLGLASLAALGWAGGARNGAVAIMGEHRTGPSWASNDDPLKDLSNTRALKHLAPLATDYWAASHSFVEPGHSCFRSMMMILLLFLQKQNLAFAVYLLGSVLSLPD